MSYVARFILWFFGAYLVITLFGMFLLELNSPVGAVIGWAEWALFHVATADLRQYEPVARMFIYVVMFMKASISLTVSAAITGVQYAQSKRNGTNES